METLSGSSRYLEVFGDTVITCSSYTLKKLGLEQNHGILRIEDYTLIIAPLQLGFKRATCMVALSREELLFFQKYRSSIAGLSLSFNLPTRKESLNFFIRCTITALDPMKGRENVGVFTLLFRNSPEEYITILGSYLEGQETLKQLYENYGKEEIRLTADVAHLMGYNLYATIKQPTGEENRIQIFSLNTKKLVHLEGAHVPERKVGTSVLFQLYFKKYRFTLSGTIQSSERLPTGILRTQSVLDFSPPLTEIIDDYYFTVRSRQIQQANPS